MATSIYTGAVTSDYEKQIKAIYASRLDRSAGKIKTAWEKWWLPHRRFHNLPDFIVAGDVNRGGQMASFMLFQANSPRPNKFSTMQGYAWGVCAKHMNEGGASCNPLDGVGDWSRFMAALEVQAFVDSSVEPRLMIPFNVLLQTLLHLNTKNRLDAALGCIMCMCYYTMSRSESPLPKSVKTFDQNKHIRRQDVRLLFDQYVEWGLGSIKQDSGNKRSQRDPDKRDWKPCGEATGVLSMRYWYGVYASQSCWASGTSPFFYGSDGKCLTYSTMLAHMRECMARVPGISQETAVKYGFHGLRVLGYNCWRAAAGEEVAVLQGGWGSTAHRTYARDELMKILGMAQKGVSYAAQHALIPMPLDVADDDLVAAPPLQPASNQVLSPGPVVVVPAPLPASTLSKRTSSVKSSNPTPPGFKREDRCTGNGRKYFVYYAPDGSRFESSNMAWIYYRKAPSVAARVPSSSGAGSSKAHATIAPQRTVPVSLTPQQAKRVSKTSAKAVFHPGPVRNERRMLKALR